MNRRQIEKLLRESSYDPKEPGPLKYILESGDPTYLQQRAIELIREAQLATKKLDKHKALKMAISLLATSRSIVGGEELETGPLAEPCNEEFKAANLETYRCTKQRGHRGRHSANRGKFAEPDLLPV